MDEIFSAFQQCTIINQNFSSEKNIIPQSIFNSKRLTKLEICQKCKKDREITHANKTSIHQEIETAFKMLYPVHPEKFRGMCVEKVFCVS